MSSNPTPAPEGKTFFGHPRGLFVLFFAEMWERFSYYGMRALLIFYLVQHWLFSDERAYAIYAAYAALVYIAPVLGGYLADRYIGQRRAVQYGAILLTIGHGLMAFEGSGGQDSPYLNIFWLALSFIIMGVGFLKSSISVMVGQLYQPGDARRDPAFTIFYMGINLGAAMSPLLCGYSARPTAGLGFGLPPSACCGPAGLRLGPAGAAGPRRGTRSGRPAAPGLGHSTGIPGLPVGPGRRGRGLVPDPVPAGRGLVAGRLRAIVLAYFIYEAVVKLDKVSRDRIIAAVFLIALQPLFWALFEQAGSSLNVYTDRAVDRTMFGWEVPAGMFQSINAIYIVLLGPVFAGLWLWLARRGLSPPPRPSSAWA